MGTLRKKRIELEVEVKTLQSRLEETEANAQTMEGKVDKLKLRIENYKAALVEHSVSQFLDIHQHDK